MGKPNARLDIQGAYAKTARFTCDQEIDLGKFQEVIADISKYHGAYPTLKILPKDPGSAIQTRDCQLEAGVILDWETWIDIGDLLYRHLGINITL